MQLNFRVHLKHSFQWLITILTRNWIYFSNRSRQLRASLLGIFKWRSNAGNNCPVVQRYQKMLFQAGGGEKSGLNRWKSTTQSCFGRERTNSEEPKNIKECADNVYSVRMSTWLTIVALTYFNYQSNLSTRFES